MVSRNIAALALAVALASTTAVAQQHEGQHKVGTAGQQVTLTACVEKGLDADTFILTRAADVPVHPATMGRVVYWLDSVEAVRPHVGSQVRIEGQITEVEQSEMEVKAGKADDGGWYVEIEGPGHDVRTPAANVGVPTVGRQDEADDIKTTLVKLKVGEVVQVAKGCPKL